MQTTPSTKRKRGAAMRSTKSDYLEEINTRLKIPKKNNGIRVVSLFAGGGGLDLGFASAGFDIRFTTDIVDSFCETNRHNLPNNPVVETQDINNLKGSYVKKKAGEIDFIIGGPPCQSFSILGRRGGAHLDPRGKLVFEYVRFIKETNPKGFLFENVPGLLSVNNGKDWKMIRGLFEDTGYKIYQSATPLNAAEYGVPQFRERIVLIGLKSKREFEWPRQRFSTPKNPDSSLPPARPASVALRKISGLANHTIRVHSDRVASRYKRINPGDRDRVDHTDRIDPRRPSGTVLVGSGGGGGRPFIHPSEHRHISVREAARLQSFPDWWEFQGTITSQYRQVGNAVPVLMAHHIAKSIEAALK